MPLNFWKKIIRKGNIYAGRNKTYASWQELCSEMGEPLKITKIYLKVNGKMNLEKAKKLFK